MSLCGYTKACSRAVHKGVVFVGCGFRKLMSSATGFIHAQKGLNLVINTVAGNQPSISGTSFHVTHIPWEVVLSF